MTDKVAKRTRNSKRGPARIESPGSQPSLKETDAPPYVNATDCTNAGQALELPADVGLRSPSSMNNSGCQPPLGSEREAEACLHEEHSDDDLPAHVITALLERR